VPAKDGAEIDRKNEVILRASGWAQHTRLNLSCPPTRNTALTWDARGIAFSVPSITRATNPMARSSMGARTRGMDRLGIALDGGNITVNLDGMHKQDSDPGGWAAAVVHIP